MNPRICECVCIETNRLPIIKQHDVTTVCFYGLPLVLSSYLYMNMARHVLHILASTLKTSAPVHSWIVSQVGVRGCRPGSTLFGASIQQLCKAWQD